MTTFTQGTRSQAVVPVDRASIWAALTDPVVVARLTPFVKDIAERDGHWIWSMTGLSVLGRGFAGTFTEKMTLVEHERIEFVHDPPSGHSEPAAVQGYYVLGEADGGTHLEICLEVCVDLPLPRISGGAVRTAMKGVMGTMGDRFAANLLRHLNVPSA